MKTLIIHPKDSTTKFLEEIYSDKDWTISDANCSKSTLKALIKEHDRIIMLGHGTQNGLLGYNRLVIGSNWVYLLREKMCVCIWCNADIFFKKYNIKCFYTGMIISEIEEAINFSFYPTTNDQLIESNILFSNAIKLSIDSTNMLDEVLKNYIGDNHIIDFNRNNVYYRQ